MAALSAQAATALTGQVTDHRTGVPLAGITVRVLYFLTPFSSPTVLGDVPSGGDGNDAWTGTCGVNVCHVVIDDPAFVAADTTFLASEPAVVRDFALVEPATITGTVTVDGSTPPRDPAVHVEYINGDGHWQPLFGATSTWSDDQYAIGRVEPGRSYRVCAGGLDTGTLEQCFDHHDRTSLAIDPASDLLTPDEGATMSGIDFALATGGAVGGTLHDGYLGVPLQDTPLTLTFYDAGGQWLAEVATMSDSTGAYRVSGLPDGTYYVDAAIGSSYFRDWRQVYPGLACDGACPPVTDGQPLQVSATAPVTGIDFTVHPAVVIRGRVTDAGSGQGLAGATVGTYTERRAVTDAGGDYVLYERANVGPIHVLTVGSQPRIDQTYPGIACLEIPCPEPGQAFDSTLGAVHDHVDFSLEVGAAIAGTLYDALSGAPRDGAEVTLYDASYTLVWTGYVGADGRYLTGAGQPGIYYVKMTAAPWQGWPYGCAVYDGRPCPAGGGDLAGVAPTAIDIGLGEIRDGIDFHIGDALFASGFDG